MKIVVIGGSGLIGTKVVARLRQQGHDVTAASPRSGVNTVTGEGLTDVLTGAQVVVDVANSPSFEDRPAMEFFEQGGHHLLEAEAIAGVQHHVALSVVGTDRLQQSGYFRAKQVQENLIKASSIPYTIVRATQFMEFLDGIVAMSTDGDGVRLSPAGIQPIAAEDVAEAMTDAAVGKPLNGTFETAGPEQFILSELIQHYLTRKGDPRRVVTDRHAPYSGVELAEQTLLPGSSAYLGRVHFATWLASQLLQAK
jgi:uncharacterized protein YbjT (DUF2867 family)